MISRRCSSVTEPIVKIMKKADDTTTVPGKNILRVSLGGTFEDGYYIVYRGDADKIRELLTYALLNLHRMKEEPPIEPEDGRHM
jgi:hypothetical protein